MTRYEKICSINNDFVELVRIGLIPVNMIDYKVFYEKYLEELECEKRSFKRVKKTRAISNVADNYNVSDRTIKRVIAFMESLV